MLAQLLQKQLDIQQHIDTINHTLNKSTSRRIKMKLNHKLMSYDKNLQTLVKTYQRLSNCCLA